jgi:surface polysaccharide O-acyltransferase-like enzyme
VGWIDNARVLAVFAVVCLHVAASIVAGVPDWNSLQWWEGNLFDAATRWCVPVLVMVSGALLLDSGRREDAPTFYRKRAARILAPLLFWSAFYLGWRYLKGWHKGAPPTASELGESVLMGVPYFHLWYLYMIAGLYLVTPLLRLLLQRVGRGTLYWLVALLFLINGTSSAAGILLELNLGLPLHWFISYLPYFLAGHLIATSAWQPPPLALCLALLAAILATATGCYLGSGALGLQRGLYFYNYLSITVIPMSLCAMLLLKQRPALLPSATAQRMGQLSLGIYLVHPVLLELLHTQQIYPLRYPALLAIPGITLLTYGAAAVVSWLIGRVPLLQRVV